MDQQEYQKLVEQAEQTLIEQVKSGDIHAVIFFLTRHDKEVAGPFRNENIQYKEPNKYLQTKAGPVLK